MLLEEYFAFVPSIFVALNIWKFSFYSHQKCWLMLSVILQVSSWTGAGWRSAAPSRRRCWLSVCASCRRRPGSCCHRARGGRPRKLCASSEDRTPPSNGSAPASKTPAMNRWACGWLDWLPGGGGDGVSQARLWFVIKRRSIEQREVLCKVETSLVRKGRTVSSAVPDNEMCRCLYCLSVFAQGSSFRLSDLKDPGVYKPLVIGFMLMFFQQTTGINAIMFYAENIFEQAHFKVRGWGGSLNCYLFLSESHSSVSVFTQLQMQMPHVNWVMQSALLSSQNLIPFLGGANVGGCVSINKRMW